MAHCCFRIVSCCQGIQGFPSAFICVLFFLLQAACMDYFLVDHLGSSHFIWLSADAVNLTLLVICIYVSRNDLKAGTATATAYSISAVSWTLMSSSLAVKMIILFIKVAHKLEEDDPGFMGPNMLKTGIALSGIIFISLLSTQHDAPVGSERRNYVEELTGTVVFDLLDTVDILEVLFDFDKRSALWDGLPECILAVATLNLLIPAVPLVTLSRSNYGREKIHIRMVYFHRLALVLIVNVPNLAIRMILWHGFSVGISPFVLKNLILIFMTIFVFYEHFKERFEDDQDKGGVSLDNISAKYRYSRDLRGPEESDPNSHKPPPLYTLPGNEQESESYSVNYRPNRSRDDDVDSRLSERSSHRNSRYNRNSHNDSRGSYHNDFNIESRMVTSI